MSGNEEEKPIETPQTSPDTPAEAIVQPEKEPEYISATKVKSSFTRLRAIEVRGGDLILVSYGERDRLLPLEQVAEWYEDRHTFATYKFSRGDTALSVSPENRGLKRFLFSAHMRVLCLL